jgi:ORF6N domain-containing protein
MPKQLPRSPLDFEAQIIEVRGQRVMLDETLADLYGVSTKVFNQAVRRNRDRFPSDFLLAISDEEWKSLRSQFVTLDVGRGRYRKYAPRRQFDQVYEAILGLMVAPVRKQ